MYASEPISAAHQLEQFNCGKPDLNHWLHEYAQHASAMRTARTWVWAERRSVVAFYAIGAHQIVKDSLPSRVRRGSPQAIPAVLLGKLALDVSLRGKGLGGELLVDALERVLLATQQVAVRIVVVDAADGGSVGFYEHFGFVRTAPDSLRLVRKVSDIERDINGVTPSP